MTTDIRFLGDFDTGPERRTRSAETNDVTVIGLLALLYRRKWLIALGTLLFAILAIVAVDVFPPQFVGESVVEPRLDTSANGPATTADPAAPEAPNSPELVRSEIDVVQSLPVVDEVIATLHLEDDPKLNKEGLLSRIFSPRAPSADPKTTKLRIVEENVLDHLKVDNDGRSFGLHIQYTSEDPNKAANISNALAQSYLQQQLTIRTSVANKTLQWLNARLAVLQSAAGASEAAVADYKVQNHLLEVTPATQDADKDVEPGQTLAAQQMGQLNVAVAAAKAAAITASTRLGAATGNGGRSSSEVNSSPIIQGLVAQEAMVEQNVTSLEAHYGAKYPALIAARDQLQQIRAKITAETDRILSGIAADADAAKRAEELTAAKLNAVEAQASLDLQHQVKLDELQRRADADKLTYQQFLAKEADAAESAASQVPSPVIVSTASPPLFPAFPKKKLLVLIATALGLMVSAGAAVLIDTRRRAPIAATR